MNVKNYILRKLVGDSSNTLTVEQVQRILESQKDDDRIFRAIINSSLSNQKLQAGNSEFHINTSTDFGHLLLNQLQSSLQSIKSKNQLLSFDQFPIDINQFNIDISQTDLMKQQLQYIYRLFKATIRQNGDGLKETQNYLANLNQAEQIIESQYAQQCIMKAPQYIQGIDQINLWCEKSSTLYQTVISTRQLLQESKRTSLKKQLQIVEKYKSIQRIKYTLEKLMILKQTFGQLAQAMNKYDDNAYEIIPIMKETQNNINKYKLNELKLACISDNFFENKIESLKERIKSGILANFMKFDEKKYYSLLKSYYFIEKHYQMQSYVTQIWGLAKKSISVTFKNAIKLFEQSYIPHKIYQNCQDEDLLQFYKLLYSELVEQMLNFHYCNRFHQENDFKIEEEDGNSQFEEYTEQIRQSYLEMRQLIWSQIQKKIVKIINAHLINIKSLVLEQLIYFLGYNCLLIKRAEDFSHSDSQQLTKCIIDVYMSFVQQFHKTNLKSISTYLQNELYQRLPLTKDSKLIQQLEQLTNLNQVNTKLFEYLIEKREENYHQETKKTVDFQDLINNDKEMQLFYLFEYQNPFVLQQEEFDLIIKAIWIKKYATQSTGVLNQIESVLSSSSIRILELLPQYALLSFYHPSCQQQIIANFLQLLELYMFVSYNQLVGITQQKQILENFSQIMKFDESKEIEFFVQTYDSFSDCLVLQERFCYFKRFVQKFCKEGIDFKEIDIFASKEKRQFVDIAERAIASESLAYLLSQTKSVFSLIGITSQNFDIFKEVYNQYKEFIYRNFVQTYIKIDGIVQYVPQQRWDLKDLHNENNNIYLDRLIQFILDQRDRLKSIGGGVIPPNAQKDIFSFLAEHCLNVLLETYGKIKKLNSIGRDQMVFEYTTCCQSIESSQKNSKEVVLNPKITLMQLEYLKVFNSQQYEEIDQYIQKSKTLIPLRLLYNLMSSSSSYNKLSKQQKKDIQVKFFKDYYDTFKLF
ncbi:unnamed protein product (macronuclear) [Paramecium tetraurelia]|uniref:Syndetin C-terminal domain-containing protein n=1 Tax=Paramecium tetraurelia TaxID=5888 RepID=A0DTZ8_PARTE|nr:uncharacterized protein GSPATT00020199001 [Paramecium tetraurelia]CAK86515.1 unnamed protein product [Paramecium tetraurelia]|eukprot:XP_001453912.1 hypothetical protein (macronuclear) [Paramecium tetraurelia strain d4-2]